MNWNRRKHSRRLLALTPAYLRQQRAARFALGIVAVFILTLIARWP
jgi:hypothetical protein